MARVGDPPNKAVLAGNEKFLGEDPSTDRDITTTPVNIVQFAQGNLSLAAGSANGFVTPQERQKLDALFTQEQFDNAIEQLSNVAIPIFISTPSDGSISIYQHVCDTPWVMAFAYGQVSAGSTNFTLTRNGAPIAGLTSGGITTVDGTFTVTDSPANSTFNKGDVLGVTLGGTTGNCANMLLSVRANAIIAP